MKEKINFFKVNIWITFVAMFLTIVYAVSASLLSEMELYYRTWVLVIGDVISFLIFPMSLFLCLIKGKRLMKLLTSTGLLVILFLILTVFRMPSWEKERFIKENVIEETHPIDLGSMMYHRYYSCENAFLKRKYEKISDIVMLKMEERYGEEFEVCQEDLERELSRTVGVYTVYPVDDPTVQVHVFGLNVYYEFTDDYGQAKVNQRLKECAELENYIVPGKAETKTVFQVYDERIPAVTAPTIEVQNSEEFQMVAGYLAKCLNHSLLPGEQQSGCVYLCGEVERAAGYNRETYVGLAEYVKIPEEERAEYLYRIFCDSHEENISEERLEEVEKERNTRP